MLRARASTALPLIHIFDERSRGHHVGSTLYRYVLDFARQSGCHNVTLNVWACNPKAQAFYERMGLTPYYIGMEQVL